MIHRASGFNVKKLERTSACEPKLSIGHTYSTATPSPEWKTHKEGEKDKDPHKPQTAKSPH
jgi:hypothetical protein